jgi:hypothetical protein
MAALPSGACFLGEQCRFQHDKNNEMFLVEDAKATESRVETLHLWLVKQFVDGAINADDNFEVRMH